MNEREILIHLNITVTADSDAAALEAALAYVLQHKIPADDIALIDPQ